MEKRPIKYCYWVEPGHLLAGEYPRNKEDNVASRAKLKYLTAAGVTTFIDLTEEGELSPYAQWLDSERQTYYRFPIFDLDIPDTPATTTAILDTIDAHIATDDVVYLHCWGGAHGDHSGLLAGPARVFCGLGVPGETLGQMPQVRLDPLTGDGGTAPICPRVDRRSRISSLKNCPTLPKSEGDTYAQWSCRI